MAGRLNIILTLELFFILAVCVQADEPEGKAVIKIRLQKFDSKGDDRNGDRCDVSVWPFPDNIKKCDSEFIFCVDKYSGSGSMSSCAYYKKESDHYGDRDIVEFTSTIRDNIPNPISIKVKNYEGIRFKVDVDDVDDHNGDDPIDEFDWRYNSIPDKSEALATRNDKRIKGKRSGDKAMLEFYIMVYCDVNSYGDDCSVYCELVDQEGVGHYGCNPDTGERYCLDGWEDLETNCLIKLDNCASFSCANDGVCLDEYDGFSCLCRDGYTGELCELNIDECESTPCLNGGICVDGVNGYTCSCTNLHPGLFCELHVCNHPNDYCLNGGICYENDNNTVVCVCPLPYTGIHCDVHACQILNCIHGECNNDGVCECDIHFMGGLCDVKECEQIPCQSGGTCLDSGQCSCQHGYTGTFCENVQSPCENQPCMNNAECVAVNNTEEYYCWCQPGYNGTRCEYRIPVNPDNNYNPQIDKEKQTHTKDDNSGVPAWGLGLIITVAVLCLIIVIVVTLLLKFRRKYRKSVENPPLPESPQNMANFVNPLYSEPQPQPNISYSASSDSATINTITDIKKPLDDLGAAAPPPYTFHPDDVSKIPLPTYEQSETQQSGAVAFMNRGYDGSPEKNMSETCEDNAVTTGRHCDRLETSANSYRHDYDNPLYTNLSGIRHDDVIRNNNSGPMYLEPSTRRCSPPQPASGNDPLYAQVPTPRPVENRGSQLDHTYDTPYVDMGVPKSPNQTSVKATRENNNSNVYTTDMLDCSMAQNELNASLEGSIM